MFRVAAIAPIVLLLAASGVLSAQEPATPKPAPTPAAAEKANSIVNLNTATAADLESLPGIGEKGFLKIKSRLTVGAPKA